MIWKYRKYTTEEEAWPLARELTRPVKYCQFLLARGFHSASEIRSFTDAPLKNLPRPERMPGMKEAVELFLKAKERGDTIAIYGDYDADGLTATAVLSRFFSSLGYKVISRIPNRLSDGYGLNPQAVQDLYDQGAGLLVTVDCGVSDFDAILLANDLNLPVVITDHHVIPPVLPPAQAIINPHLGKGFEVSPLAGVGVAFMLAWGVHRAFERKNGKLHITPPLVEYLSLVALGTIADLAPLTGINRTLVRNGLKYLSRSEWPSLRALKSAARLDLEANVTVRDVGFRLAPKLNAAGRLGSATPALELLTTDDESKALTLADKLEQLNRARYEGQMKLLELALEKLKETDSSSDLTVVLSGVDWPKGLLGLVASKVAELTHKPTVLFSLEDDKASGSGRTAPGFDLYTALSDTRDLCISLGGHSEAAGLKLMSENLEEFKEVFEESAARQPLPGIEDEVLIDFEASLEDLTVLAKYFQELEPFGQGYPSPHAVVRNVKVTDAAPTRTNGDKHMVLRIVDGTNLISLVGYNMARLLPTVEPLMDIVLTFDSSMNNFKLPNWRVVDFKSAGSYISPW
ncbi:MAG: single-stranded-DNA-specific exonuclease RecJ [Deltaproteobacteria bacterium]|jgi:single-stranded-DNA-specific exonuclease|nr:single-stranded-DNA-specific exonuclease RecJ [Deltaproteobacteria bacterium]